MGKRKESGADDWYDPRWQQAVWQADLRKRLVRWFERIGRELPWRQTHDPYAIWVSEIMLQQTQVVTVIPYYDRFLQRFPTVSALAAAPIDEVLVLWEGLGYYRRARQLHAAAQQIVTEHKGRFPATFAEVLALPGIGRYTAGAILSFSSDQRFPILEANTLRLFSRLVGMRKPVAETSSQRVLWQVAESILPARSGSGKVNQAAMELGALVCTPREPQCTICPVQKNCAAYELGLQNEIPGVVKRLKYEDRRHWAIAASSQGKYLMRVCPPDAHWAGMWDFPRFDVTGHVDAAAAVLAEFNQRLGCKLELGDALGSIKHAVTRFRITLELHRGECQPQGRTAVQTEEIQPWESAWFSLSELKSLPLNASARKLVDRLE